MIPGWQQSTFGLREYSHFPSEGQRLPEFLSDEVGVKIVTVSTGPERQQAIWMDESSFVSDLIGR